MISIDASSIMSTDFDASVDAKVTQLVTGWTPLMDSTLKGSAVINASANASLEHFVVSTPPRADLRRPPRPSLPSFFWLEDAHYKALQPASS